MSKNCWVERETTMKNIDPAYLFTLRVNGRTHGEKPITVKAYELFHKHTASHMYFTVEVTQGGETIFPKGELYAGVSTFAGHSIDGDTAKKLALELVAMKPGDTDEEYFEGYSDEQCAWAEENGEWLSYIAAERYGES